MISIKKYLDWEPAGLPLSQPNQGELFRAALNSYRSALLDMGKSGYRACPAFGSNLQQTLSGLEGRLANQVTVSLLQETGKEVTVQLSQWGECTAEHLKGKAQEVKDLLIMLARTAESLGERDQRYASQLNQFTTHLRAVADLDDLTQVRASLMQTANELKSYVDQMERDSRQAIAQLEARVSTYETKLKASEELALRDPLTGLPNRLHLERRIAWRIENQQPFCVVFLDLNQFKRVNDRYGHVAGDVLLKQFAGELKTNLRPGDLVGRWSGDEFVVLLDCDLAGAAVTTDRVRRWVFGDYTIEMNGDSEKLRMRVDAAIGIAEWAVGETVEQVINRADHAMYENKKQAKPQVSGRRADSNPQPQPALAGGLSP